MKKYFGCGIILISIIFCSGCMSLHFKGSPYSGSYNGLTERMDETKTNNATLRIIMVHGMAGLGPTMPGYGSNFADIVACSFKLSPAMDSVTQPLVSTIGITNYLRTFSYTNDQNERLKFYELTWSPTTSQIKSNEFAEDLKMNDSKNRLPMNKTLKGIIDFGFGDAALYLNPSFRTNMQEPILQTIERVESDSTNDFDRIVFVTHSLGSKMTLDTILANTNNEAVTNLLGKSTDIIMLANQVPLIDLGTEPVSPWEEAAEYHRSQTLDRFLDFIGTQRKEHSKREHKKYPELTIGNPTVNVVAATDPNDALSFPLKAGTEMHNGTIVSISQIYKYNDSGIWLGKYSFEYPLTAHENYLTNKRLIKKLVFGFPPK